jgi:hypothetical protein
MSSPSTALQSLRINFRQEAEVETPSGAHCLCRNLARREREYFKRKVKHRHQSVPSVSLEKRRRNTDIPGKLLDSGWRMDGD